MKAVLMSIQPCWCELIASGKKTIEVRKTRPQQIETPFKVYIYCTKKTRKNALHTYINSGVGARKYGLIGHWRSGKEVVDVNAHLPAYRYNSYLAEGKIIGEFVCDRIMDMRDVEQEPTCLTIEEWLKYTEGHKKSVWGWHISKLVIYDKPRELSEFTTPCAESDKERPRCGDCEYYYSESNESIGFYEECACDGLKPIKRPPQSWCYVYEREREK